MGSFRVFRLRVASLFIVGQPGGAVKRGNFCRRVVVRAVFAAPQRPTPKFKSLK
jgi:hypothetical protein